MISQAAVEQKKDDINTAIKIAVQEGIPAHLIKILRAKYEMLAWVLEEK